MRFAGTFSLLLLLFLSSMGARAQDNLAPHASGVEASEEAADNGPRHAVDGSADTFWEVSGSTASPSWIEISWAAPVAIRELVLRRGVGGRGKAGRPHLRAQD